VLDTLAGAGTGDTADLIAVRAVVAGVEPSITAADVIVARVPGVAWRGVVVAVARRCTT
jgi:hypothetical protein